MKNICRTFSGPFRRFVSRLGRRNGGESKDAVLVPSIESIFLSISIFFCCCCLLPSVSSDHFAYHPLRTSWRGCLASLILVRGSSPIKSLPAFLPTSTVMSRSFLFFVCLSDQRFFFQAFRSLFKAEFSLQVGILVSNLGSSLFVTQGPLDETQ